jgi:CheY-like chemotaxis protein
MPNLRPILLVDDSTKIDGLEVLERVKSDPGIRHIAIVMLTSCFREEQDLVRSDALGATNSSMRSWILACSGPFLINRRRGPDSHDAI